MPCHAHDVNKQKVSSAFPKVLGVSDNAPFLAELLSQYNRSQSQILKVSR